MLRIASLGSGSKGNATLVSNGNTTVLIDCGFSLKKIHQKAAQRQIELSSLDAILVTHEHGDHSSGVVQLACQYQIPLYMTVGTACKLDDCQNQIDVRWLSGDLKIQINDLAIDVVTVPHDASEPVQFVITCGRSDKKLGILTDAGHVSAHMVEQYASLNGLLLEFNYDPQMLQNGPYPPTLKQRVGGNYGHLSNTQSIDFLRQVDCDGLQLLIAGHISQNNNHPDRVQALLDDYQFNGKSMLATQDEGFGWVDI